MNTWQTTLGTLFIIYSYSLADCTKNQSQRTHFEWHKIVFLHQQDESQKAFMMWKEKEKAVVRQLTQELD